LLKKRRIRKRKDRKLENDEKMWENNDELMD